MLINLMSRCALGTWVILASSLVARHSMAAETPAAIDIGSRRELLVDDFLIDRFIGKAELRLHHPVPREEALRWDQPWEGNTSSYTEVFRHGDGYRMYYRGWQYIFEPKLAQGHSPYACVAESDDGIHWRRPELGLFTFKGSTANNILDVPTRIGEYRTVLSTFTVSQNENPDTPPDARYIGFALVTEPRGLIPFKSADGLRWAAVTDKPVITGDAFDSPNRVFWDPIRKEYRAYYRYVTSGTTGNGGIRGIKTAVSKDLVTWTEGRRLEYPGAAADEQLYTNGIAPYYRAPHLFVGFPMRYLDRGWSDSMRALPDREHRELRSKAEPRVGTAVTDTLFMTSRDGDVFRRWGEAFLRPGIERPGTWNYNHTNTSCGVVETRSALPGAPNELSFYADDDYWTGKQGSAVRRYTLRIDGFVSASAPASGGEIVTKPLKFAGSRLELNFASSAAGGVQIEIQDEAGEPLPGFALADCPPIFGDSLERTATWNNGADVRQLAGRPVRLRFVLEDADLYSFRFADAADEESDAASSCEGEAVSVGRHKQFFADDGVIESQSNVTRELHQPRRIDENPVLVGDQSWEAWIVEAHGRPIVFDPETKEWKLFYVTWVPDSKAAFHQRYLTCLAVSKDGIAWTKPKLGQYEWDGSRENNILNVDQINWMRRPNVLYDDRETDPERQFKMTFVDVLENGKTAIVRAASPDGVSWHRLGEPWINSGFGHNLNLMGWDDRAEAYVLFPRFVVEGRVGVGRSTSKDFVTWSQPTPVVVPEKDEPHLEFKGLAAFQYEGAYWGCLWQFEGVKRAESELAFSRDGALWTRPFRGEIFFPRGAPDEWDCEMVLPVAPVVRDDALWFYYTGWNFPYGPAGMSKVRKGWIENDKRKLRAVGVAKLRLDGFASLSAGDAEGVVTTKPFELTGDKLLVNVAAPKGSASVEVLDGDGAPIPGFAGDSASSRDRFDELRWQPNWKSADLSTLRGKVVRLRFQLRDARLYSFQVQ